MTNSEIHWQWKLEEWDAAQAAAEQAVRAAPRNPFARASLANYLTERSKDIRRAKYSADMTRQEKQAVAQLYPQALAAAWRVTQISPMDSSAWQRVAVRATFTGYDALAEKAMGKSLELDNTNGDAYGWGLQMYQPNWGGDKEKLMRVARMAVQHANPDNFPGIDFEEAIFHGGLEAHREELFTAALKRSPRNAVVNYNVGVIYHYNQHQYKKAEEHYRVALAAEPEYARALASLANLHYFVKNDSAGAGRLYRKAVKILPGDQHLREKLATFEANTGGATP